MTVTRLCKFTLRVRDASVSERICNCANNWLFKIWIRSFLSIATSLQLCQLEFFCLKLVDS